MDNIFQRDVLLIKALSKTYFSFCDLILKIRRHFFSYLPPFSNGDKGYLSRLLVKYSYEIYEQTTFFSPFIF
jgi:hypothetical protein